LAAGAGDQPLKVGFIMDGPISDQVWNFAHNQGRLYLESNLHGRVQTNFVEKVPETAESERVMEKLIAQGNKLIFATSYGYLEPVLRVAARHPDVLFMYCGRCNPKPMKNVATYFARYHEPLYVAGVVAGRMTKRNEIGFLAGHPVPEVLTIVDAFTLGARSVNPKVRVHVIWINSWNDPVTEAEAAKSLAERGVDVLVGETITVVRSAEKNHLYSAGYCGDLHDLAPNGWLTGQCWNWGPLYAKVANSVLDHTWKPGDGRYGLEDDYVRLSPFGSSVPNKVRQEALNLLKEIAQGKLVIFKGPMKDREGKERIPAGKAADDNYLETLDWLVPGVDGALPKK
jgi:basic membrane protein A